MSTIRELLVGLRPVHEPDDGPLFQQIRALIDLCLSLEDRLGWGEDAPLIVALLGATGTGKSKLFNSLAGAPVSPSGFKRPTTLAPVLLAAREYKADLDRDTFLPAYKKKTIDGGSVVFDPQENQVVMVVESDQQTGPDLILADTPDFDSVVAANRRAARDIFDRADAIVFVTDAVKYADQAAWQYLDRIRERTKTAVLVVNRVKNPLSLEDFKNRLERSGLSREVLSLSDQPLLSDQDLFSRQNKTLQEIKDRLALWTGPQRSEILVRELKNGADELRRRLNDRLLPVIHSASRDFLDIETALGEAGRLAKDDLTRNLSVAISGELKNSLLAQIQNLFLQWDPLRYPRRLLAVPFNFIRDKIMSPLGVTSSRGGAGSLDQEIDRLFEANQETLVTVIHEYNRRAAAIFTLYPAGQGLSERTEFTGLAWPADDVRAGYARVRTDLETWVQEQARELVRGLNLGEKMTFYLAQVVSLGLFISIQVQTGGGFSFFDFLLDGILAPVLSKITGHALSREKVKTFENQAAQKHHDGCQELLEKQARVYLDFLTTAGSGLTASTPLAEAAGKLTRAFDL